MLRHFFLSRGFGVLTLQPTSARGGDHTQLLVLVFAPSYWVKPELVDWPGAGLVSLAPLSLN